MAIQYGDGTNSGVGRIIRVEKQIRSDTASQNSSNPVDVFNIAITPESSSSKFLILADLKLGWSSYQTAAFWKIVRTVSGVASYDLFIGAASGNRARCTYGTEEPSKNNNAIYEIHSTNASFLDEPNTTTQCSFKIMWFANQQTVYLNRTGSDGNSNAYPRCASSLTVMEIAG